jgi:hypothetical protein
MHYSKRDHITFYLIGCSRSDTIVPLIKERLGFDYDEEKQETKRYSTNCSRLTQSPFALHAIISGLAFEQSIDYVSNVKKRLMDQVRIF